MEAKATGNGQLENGETGVYANHSMNACRYGDQDKDKGIQTTPDAKFFAISAMLPEVFDNKERDLVIQV